MNKKTYLHIPIYYERLLQRNCFPHINNPKIKKKERFNAKKILGLLKQTNVCNW